MDGVEHEICNNCKKEIPQHNYVMHTMHCARNITLCKQCKEPIPKAQFAQHETVCKPKPEKKPLPPPTNLERSSYFQARKAVEDKKIETRKERYLQKMERLVPSGHNFRETTQSNITSTQYDSSILKQNGVMGNIEAPYNKDNETGARKKTTVETKPSPAPPSGMLACKYCDLDLPKLELEEHENYCGTRTDKCLECGELVMFRDKQSHMDSNHSHLKKRGQNNTAWDSMSRRTENNDETPRRRREQAFRGFADFNYDPTDYLPSAYQAPTVKKKEGESYKEISRRLDCKTEYIRNLLHDSAGITVPLRRNATTPRNVFLHNKGPSSPTLPAYRRRNPPTELVIPCEFCDVPIPHEELVEHTTGCRPDLARFNPRRRAHSPEFDDDFNNGAAAATPTAPPSDEELPCEFCGDMIPASQLWMHQIRCT